MISWLLYKIFGFIPIQKSMEKGAGDFEGFLRKGKGKSPESSS
jgi:hypothetical protein